jgi:hypothetical protein
MTGGIGSLMEDANYHDGVFHDLVVENVPLNGSSATFRKEPRHGNPGFGKIG